MIKKRKLVHKQDLEMLVSLTKDENSCVHVHRLRHHIALHPYHLNDLAYSAADILSQGIARYNSNFEGILFGFNNIEFLSNIGAIWDDFYFIHSDIEADFFVFKPDPEKLLKGTVNKKSKDHIGCMVYKIFNVSIPKKRSDEEFWIGDSVTLGSEVELKIIHSNFEGVLPYMRGEIVSVLSDTLEKSKEQENRGKKKKKKSAKIIKFDESMLIPEDELNAKPEKKKKKHKKDQDTSHEIEKIIEIEEDSLTKKRSSKKGKVVIKEEPNVDLNISEDKLEYKKKSKKIKKECDSDIKIEKHILFSEYNTTDENVDETIERKVKKRKHSQSESFEDNNVDSKEPKKKKKVTS